MGLNKHGMTQSSAAGRDPAHHMRDIIALQQQWWSRTNAQPLVGTFAPVDCPYAGLDVDADPAIIVDRKLANLQVLRTVPADNLYPLRVDFGTAFLPALGGAGFEYDGHTSWSIPCAASAAELKITPFDQQHPLWRKYVALYQAVLARWRWETYLPSTTVMCGPLDILSAMLGPETLAMELVIDPDSVHARAKEAAQLFIDVYDIQTRKMRDAGLADGMADWMNTWIPGDGICFSEDFAALVGNDHFVEFFTEPDRMLINRLDTAYLHLHSGAIQCLPGVLDLGLSAMELSNDPAGPPIERLIDAARRVQAAGLPLQISNWQKPLTVDQITHLLQSLDPRGLKITLQADSLDHAHELYQLAKSIT